MNTKNKHTIKLQKSSLLFFQLGLVLALFTVYVAVEHKTEISQVSILPPVAVKEVSTYNFYDNIRIEEKEVVKKKVTKTQKKTSLENLKPTKKETVKETPLPFEDPDKNVKPTNVDLTKLIDEEEDDDLEDDSHLNIDLVQEIPIYPGCEKVKESERRSCFENKIRKHISRKFNASLAPSLGLSSGKQRIFVEFLITKTGEIKITNSSAPHKSLENEGRRVVNKLPTMIPGKQNGKEVNVKYTIPIIFDVN